MALSIESISCLGTSKTTHRQTTGACAGVMICEAMCECINVEDPGLSNGEGVVKYTNKKSHRQISGLNFH